MKNKTKILIFGGSGFVGGNIAKEAEAQGLRSGIGGHGEKTGTCAA